MSDNFVTNAVVQAALSMEQAQQAFKDFADEVAAAFEHAEAPVSGTLSHVSKEEIDAAKKCLGKDGMVQPKQEHTKTPPVPPLTNGHDTSRIEGEYRHNHGGAMDTQTDTLAHFRSRPLVNPHSFAEKPSTALGHHLISNFDGSMDGKKSPAPEGAAIQFYMLNHTVSVLMHRYPSDMPLPAEALAVMQEYHRYLGKIAFYMFDYLYLISHREARHHGSTPSTWKQVFGPALATHLRYLSGTGPEECYHVAKNGAAGQTTGKVTRALSALYFWGKWSNSYGGPKWGEVALTLSKFVHGEISAEVMVDTAWTLAHNTGPIFNKGMVFRCQSENQLKEVLDVQRSGQIPCWLESLPEQRVMICVHHRDEQLEELKRQWALCKAAVPEEFDRPYDNELKHQMKINPGALYKGLDLSFGFQVPADETHLLHGAKARLHQYYGKLPKPNPANVVGTVPKGNEYVPVSKPPFDEDEEVTNEAIEEVEPVPDGVYMTVLDKAKETEPERSKA